MNEQLTNGLIWPAALASVLPTLIAGTACTPTTGDEGFRITRVDFDNASTITLTFSEPLADLGEVNPNDFRLSLAMTRTTTYSYEGLTYTYAYTSYNEVAYVVGIYGYDYGSMRFTFESITGGAADNQIVLTSSIPLGPDACDWLEVAKNQFEMYSDYYQDSRFDLAIFLHYASGDVPIENQSGVELGEIGPDWVLTEKWYVSREEYGFTELAPQLRIPCP